MTCQRNCRIRSTTFKLSPNVLYLIFILYYTLLCQGFASFQLFWGHKSQFWEARFNFNRWSISTDERLYRYGGLLIDRVISWFGNKGRCWALIGVFNCCLIFNDVSEFGSSPSNSTGFNLSRHMDSTFWGSINSKTMSYCEIWISRSLTGQWMTNPGSPTNLSILMCVKDGGSVNSFS